MQANTELEFIDVLRLKSSQDNCFYDYLKNRTKMTRAREPKKKEPYYERYIREQQLKAEQLRKEKKREEAIAAYEREL